MNPYKFLIIEDDQAAREVLTYLLKKYFNCQIREAENGEIGLQVLKEYIPDLILLDLSMPVLDGTETLKQIRNNPFFKNIPVIILTAHGGRNTVNDLLELGVSEYILKPIEFDITIKRITNVLELFRTKKTPDLILNSNTHQILLVTKSDHFSSFFKECISRNFIVHTAATGSEGFEIFKSYSPDYIILCDELSVLDKRIMTERIIGISKKKKTSIFLLIDKNSPIISNVFNYDGIIKKSFEKDILLNELSKLLPIELTPFEILNMSIEKRIPIIQTKYRAVLNELFGQEININEISYLRDNDTILNITFSFDAGNNLRLVYGLFATAKNIVSITNKIGNKSGKHSTYENEIFRHTAEILAEELKKELYLGGINVVKESQSGIKTGYEFPVGEWNHDICFRTGGNESFNNKFCILNNNYTQNPLHIESTN